MKLTKNDKKLLAELGYPEEDYQRIQTATSKRYTAYELEGEKWS